MNSGMAREMIDYKRDVNRKLVIAYGDFVRTEATGQHQMSILVDGMGEYKAYPTTGVDVASYGDDDTNALGRVVTQQFMQDGMEVKDMTGTAAAWTDDTLRLFPNAYYK
jgi:hypothetical protein